MKKVYLFFILPIIFFSAANGQKTNDIAVKTSAGNQKANLLFGISQIEEFEQNPDKFKPEPPLIMPDGSPIGGE